MIWQIETNGDEGFIFWQLEIRLAWFRPLPTQKKWAKWRFIIIRIPNPKTVFKHPWDQIAWCQNDAFWPSRIDTFKLKLWDTNRLGEGNTQQGSFDKKDTYISACNSPKKAFSSKDLKFFKAFRPLNFLRSLFIGWGWVAWIENHFCQDRELVEETV